MKLAIEASNIRAGGGLTHLKELIAAYDAVPEESLFLFAGNQTLSQIPDKPGLVKKSHPWLNKNSLFHMFWRLLILPGEVSKAGISLVFSPGGNWLPVVPYVSMSQNMLVFESIERDRFPAFRDRLRYHILEAKQVLSFSAAKAVIYISNYARNFICEKYPNLKTKPETVVYHGVAERFATERGNRPSDVLRLLYVSILNYYKHQDILIEAVQELNNEGLAVHLELVGPAHPAYLEKIRPLLEKAANCTEYHGAVPHHAIHEIYARSDAFIFASTCENMPNILVEAMKSGLPVICSSYGPMPEVLGENGLYFNPLSVSDCKIAIRKFLKDRPEYEDKARLSAARAKEFTWEKCSADTFRFLRLVAGKRR